jgi:3-deoxy-manno-octulosonate cytidylyltransferase (CMP-KDO synthetase)
MRSGAKVVGIIPARYQSTRLEAKLLADICGKPMIQRTYEGAARASLLSELIVAADDQRIIDAVQAFGGKAVMTSPSHRSGTERCAEVAADLDCDLVVNVQGDEPMIQPDVVDEVAKLLIEDPVPVMATLASKTDVEEELFDRAVVKVIFDLKGYALYFSRALLPHSKSGGLKEGITYYRHIGIYAYRRNFLLRYVTLPPSRLEVSEELEQLRALDNGYRIKVGVVEHFSLNVDTPQHLEKVRKMICQNSSL